MNHFHHNLATIIGINNYRNNIAELTTARPDAEKLTDLLETDYNYQVELITDNTPRKPTLNELKTLLTEWLPEQLQPPAHNNRLLFYFAGHGMPLESDDGPRGFLLPQDADPKDPSTFLPMQELHDALIALPCHHLLIILDCCFAGTFRWSSTRKSIPIPETIHRQHYDRFLRYPACQVIASSAHNQEALDFLSDKRGTGKDAQHSPFAEALFEALQDGKPDEKGKRYKKADLTKDGVITAPELYLYLRDNVETRSGERQTPGLFPLKKHDRGEYIFHDPNFDPTTLSEAPALDEANNPYRGLKPFEEQHARFFFGRQELIKHLYARIAAPDRPLTVVLGISGSGKSSLVKAGLIPYLRQRSQPKDFAIHLAQACILTAAILYSFARLPRKPWLPPNFLPIDYSHQWQILPPMRPGESPFASLARTLLAIADTPVSPQLNQLDFLNELLQGEDEQLNVEMEQVVSEGKWNSSRAKQLEQKTETLTRIIADWNDASPLVRQRLLVEHFEMLYALCPNGESESEQQRQLKQTFLACLAPLIQQLQSDPKSLVAIAHTWEQNHPGTKLLLIIDQFEELITLGRTTPQDSQNGQPEEWQQFLRLLETTLAANVPQLRIIVTLRSDFEPRFLSSETLKPYWSKARFPVRAMRSDELRQAIERPASEMALYFEPANLVDRLIDEVGQMPGALPLLSFTLSELYVRLYEQWTNDKATDRALTIDDQFEQEGGVAGSLTRRANEEYQEIGADPDLSEAGQLTMRRVMLRMLTLEGGETARRRVPDSELIYPTQEESDRVKQVVDRLVNARLLVRGQLETGEPYVEPAHDFLVRGWGMLRDWIGEEQAKGTLELQQWLTVQANDWHSNNGPLLRPSERLDRLETVLKSLDSHLNKLEKEFIEASVHRRDIEQEETKKSSLTRQLQEQAVRTENLVVSQPLNALMLSVASMGSNLDGLPEQILTPVQTSLRKTMEDARVCLRITPSNLPALPIRRFFAVAISPDDRTIASGDNTVYLWNLQTRTIKKTFQGHEDLISGIAFSRNHQLLVSSSWDGTIRLWNLRGNPAGQIFRGHNGRVFAVAFSPDSQIIVSGGEDCSIRLWNLQGEPVRQPFTGHQREVTSVAFSPDGQKIVSSSADSTICLWDRHGNPIGQPFRGHSDIVFSVAFSPDGERIASGGRDHAVCLWDLQGNLIGQPFRREGYGGYGDVAAVSFSPDGQVIVSGSNNDFTLRFWGSDGNPIGQPLTEEVNIQEVNHVTSVAFSSDGQTLVNSSSNRDVFTPSDVSIRMWDLKSISIGQPFVGHEDSICCLAFSPDGQIIVSGSWDRDIRLWNLQGKTIGVPLRGHEDRVHSVAFNRSNGQMIVSGSADSTVRLWGLQGNPIAEPFRGHEKSVKSVAFSPNGQMIVSGSADSTVRLWDLQGNPIGKPLRGHEGTVTYVAFSPDGCRIFSSGDSSLGLGSIIYVWDLQGNLLEQIQTRNGYSVAIDSHDQMVVGNSDCTISVWSLKDNSIRRTFRGHDHSPPDAFSGSYGQRVESVSFSPDSQTIASGGGDSTVRLWDLQGNPIGEPLRGHKGDILSVVFSPDGEMIASAGRDKTIRLWRSGWRSWLRVCCDRLRYHPVFTNPESIEDLEQRKIAIAACKTCEKYVWNKAPNSVE